MIRHYQRPQANFRLLVGDVVEPVEPPSVDEKGPATRDPVPAGPSTLTSALEGVLDLVAGLLEVGLALVGLALGLHLAVVTRVAELLLALTERSLGLVLELVVHGASFGWTR